METLFPPIERTPFVARERELALLSRALDSALESRGKFVLVRGEPGVGKTRLCEEGARLAADRGCLTLRGQCIEGEASVPFLPFVHILEAAAAALAPEELGRAVGASGAQLSTLAPHLRALLAVGASEHQHLVEFDRAQMFGALRDFFDRASRLRPLVIVIDDVHWASASTLTLMRHLLQFVSSRRVLALATYRPGEVGPAHQEQSTTAFDGLLEDVHRAPDAEVLELGELDRHGVGELLRALTRKEPTDAAVNALFEQTIGNPFFIEQIVKHLAEEGKLFDAEGEWRTAWLTEDHAIPESVRLVVDRRLRRTDEACRRVLTGAAVIGRSFSYDLLSQVMDIESEALLDAVEQAEHAGLLLGERKAGGLRLTFAHDLIRQTLLARLSSARLQQWHLRVAETIELGPGDPDDEAVSALAHHYLEAGAAVERERTIHWAVAAAEQAMSATAYEKAAALYRGACACVPRGDLARRCELLLSSGEALKLVRDSDEARAAFAEAAICARSTSDAKQLARAALGFTRSWPTIGEVDEPAVRLLREALAVASPDQVSLRARLTSRLALQLTFCGDPQEAEALGRQAVAMARQACDPLTLAASLQVLHAALWQPQHLQERLRVATETVDLAEEIGDRNVAMWGMRPRIADLLELGDAPAAAAEIDAYAREAAASRQPIFVWLAAVRRAMLATFRGEIDEGERLAFGALELGRQAEGQNLIAAFGGQLLVIRWLQGRLSELQPLVAAARQSQPDAVLWRAALAFILAKQQAAAARREFDALAAGGFALVPRDDTSLTILILASLVCHALGDRDRAIELYNRLLPYEGRNVVVSEGVACVGAADYYLALLASTARAGDDERHFERALELNNGMGARPWLAQTQYEFGKVLLNRRKPGDRRRGRALLDDALALAQETGMAGLQAEIEGITQSRSRAGQPAGLTTREAEVLRLLATGRSTREVSDELVLSLRTTSRHITNIYAKIGARNRAEAAAFALREGLVPNRDRT